jgi:hypothetical protein
MTDAVFAGTIGLCAALIAATARWADLRRLRRSNPDAVGFMPWTGIFFVSLFAACVTLGVAARAWFAG